MTTGTCPDGPTPGAGIGERFDPFGAHAADPYPFYARARAGAPAFYSERFDMWVVTRYDDIVAVLREPETFSSRDALPVVPRPPEIAEIMAGWDEQLTHHLVADPPEHTRLRLLTREAFAPRRIAALEPMIRELTEEFIDAMGSGPADLVSQLAYPLPLTVILRVLGIPLEDVQKCHGWTQDAILTELGGDGVPMEVRCTAARGAAAFRTYVCDLTRQRAGDPRDDLVSQLVTARVRGHEPLSTDSQEAGGVVLALIIKGHETTANLIGTVTWLLLHNPDQLAKLRRDPRLIAGTVEEALRYEAPGPGFVRTATRDVEVAGVKIPAGARCSWFTRRATATSACTRSPNGS